MKRISTLSMFVLLCFLLGEGRSKCQTLVGDQLGLLPYGSYHGGDIDSVNLENGNLTVRIPLFSLPQKRKLSLSYSLVLNNHAFAHTQFCDPPDYPGGECYWQYVRSAPIGPLLVMDQAVNLRQSFTSLPEVYCSPSCNDTPIPAPQDSITDATGAQHALLYDSSNWPLLHAVDGSGYTYQTAFTTQNFQPWFGNPRDPNLSCSYPNNSPTLLGAIYTADGISHTYQDACVAYAIDSILDISAEPSFPIKMQDRLGNTITYSIWTGDLGYTFPGTVTDSINRTIPDFYQLPYDTSISSRCPDLGTVNQPVQYSKTLVVPGPNGGQSTYTFCMTNVVYNTLFGGGLSGIMQTQSGEYYQPQAIGGSAAIQSVVLPNGTYWGFIYDSAGQISMQQLDGFSYPDPTTTPIAYGNLTKLILPTGGSIAYTYNQHDACTLTGAVDNYIATRTINDLNGNSSTWTYNYENTTGIVNNGGSGTVVPSITTVTDPNLNDTVHTYTNPPNANDACSYRVETEVQQYNGSKSQNNVVKTTTTAFANASYIYNFGVMLSYNAEPSSSTQSLTGGTSVNSSYAYPALAVLTHPFCNYVGTNPCVASAGPEQILVNFNRSSGMTVALSDGSLSNTTEITYAYQNSQAYLNANLLSLVSSEKTTDNLKNTVVNQTLYGYDEDNGSPQGKYGNLTSTSRWVNTGEANAVSEMVYNADGMPQMQIDARQHSTSISYQCSGTLPYQITNALNQTTTYGYDCNTGKITKIQDPNDVAANRQGTQYVYNTFGDLQQVLYPDAGSLSVDYHEYGNPLHITTTNTADPDPPIVKDTYYDGLARVIKTAIVGGAAIRTTYDHTGNVASITNPYYAASGATDGIISYAYDALGRVALQCQQDNGSGAGACTPSSSYMQWIYSGDVIDYYDENRRHWRRTVDLLGRLTHVWEPDANNSPSLETDYVYDALGNMLSVSQFGSSGSDVSRTQRLFTYDGLSRLITSFNPEMGTVCYGQWSNGKCMGGYDGNGNLLYRTDARGAVINYTYDALNRILSKNYNDSSNTPLACYQYDSSSITNGIGRLAVEWTQSPSAGTCFSSLPQTRAAYLTARIMLAYDPIGRLWSETQCTLSSCRTSTPCQTASGNQSYSYDLAGSLTCYGNGITGANPLSFTQAFDAAGRLQNIVSSLNGPLFNAQSFWPHGPWQTAVYGAVGGNGLTLNRAYDNRLRIIGETDSGQLITNPVPGSAIVTITGQEQSH